MARSIQHYNGQTHAPDSDYLFGDIKDDTGANDGTLADRKSNADIHQFFMKFLALAQETPTGNPDNEYHGYQFVQAVLDVVGNHRRILTKDGFPQSDVVEANYSTAVIVKRTAQNGHLVSMDVPTGSNTAPITIYNYSAFAVSIIDSAGTNNINSSGSPYSLAALTVVEFTYNGSNNWVINKKYSLDA